MARRSRRSDAVDAKPEAKGRACRMGVYARTSKSYDDDGCSIANQQRIVADHVGKLPDAVVAAYYVDDGFTGTNQDRDAFQRMIEDLRAGRIDGIAAKDASRLGRDYVECQSFIRDTLPSLGARLILVSDGVDSKDNAALDDFSIDMRSLLNDLYSRDLSRKIHATFESSRRRGPLILGNIPYGYLRDPDDPHHLVPDPATAPIVREMFRMKIAGKANAAIARWLEETGAPTAGEVKYARAGMEATSRDSRRWLARNVNRMLENPVYAGRAVMNKWTQKRYLGIPHEKNDEGEWLVVENAHEPLVQPERFDELRRAHDEKVAKMREKRTATDRIREKHPDRLPGKMRCGICGTSMSICRWIEDGVFWGAEYMCNRKDAGEGGGRHRIAVPLVETICMDVIRSQIEQRVSIERLVDSKMADGTLSRRLADAARGIAAAEAEMGDIEERALKLKGEHMGSGISSRDYKRIERTLWSQLEEAKKRRNDLVARRELLSSIAQNGAGLFAEGAGASLVDSFSAELADMAIESVTFEGGRQGVGPAQVHRCLRQDGADRGGAVMIALYCRLSVADGDGGESESIANQRLILADFVASRDDLKDEEHRFFVDDGISGTHAENRPALQEMLRCCREGRVSTVVVKDLSRLSRDNLYCVGLVEDELPSLGVRVIAVVDNYDSRRDGKSTSAGMQLGFKAIMNSWYSKDLSRKVTQGIRSEHARGMNLRTVPFAYRKGEGEYTCTADEKGAPVVRRIFELALDGLNQSEIASKLNEEGAITPHNLKVLRSKGNKWEAKPNQRWTGTMVKKIVRNPHYKGTLVLGKTRRNEIGLCSARKTEPEERFVFENAHEAIVDAADWARAQGSMADTNRGGAVEPLGHLFTGFVFCPHCGKAVSFRAGRRRRPACYTAYCGCFQEAPSIALHVLEEAVASVVRTHVDLLFGLSDAIEAAEASPERIAELRSSLRRLSVRKMRAYEAYRTGERSPEEFAALKAAMDSEEASVRRAIERMEVAAERRAPAIIDAERAFELARRLKGQELSRETLEAFVDRIELLGDDEVRITLKYADVFERLG